MTPLDGSIWGPFTKILCTHLYFLFFLFLSFSTNYNKSTWKHCPFIINVTFPLSDRAARQRRQEQRNSAMEVVQDVCGSEGVCEVMCDVPSNGPQHEESMETHVAAEEATGDTHSGSVEEETDISAAGHGNADTSTPPPTPRFSYRWGTLNGCRFIYLLNSRISSRFLDPCKLSLGTLWSTLGNVVALYMVFILLSGSLQTCALVTAQFEASEAVEEKGNEKASVGRRSFTLSTCELV